MGEELNYRTKCALKVATWGALTFMLLAGWFMNPSTTHLYVSKCEDIKTYDLISFDTELQKEEKFQDIALEKAILLSLFSFAGLVLWWSIIWFVTSSKYWPIDEPLEVPKRLLRGFCGVITIAYAILILTVVDFRLLL